MTQAQARPVRAGRIVGLPIPPPADIVPPLFQNTPIV